MAKAAVKPTAKVKKTKKVVASKGSGRGYGSTTFNKTSVTVTNERGDAISWSSSANMGYKGTRKSTPFAATQAVDEALKRAKDTGLQSVEVFIKGPGVGRDAALRAIRNSGLSIAMIADITPIPHNGTRPKKKRRV